MLRLGKIDARHCQSVTRRACLHAGALAAFAERLASWQEEGVAPPPFVTGNDLIALGAQPGPRFKAWLDQLYNRQLELEFAARPAALAAARALITQAPQK